MFQDDIIQMGIVSFTWECLAIVISRRRSFWTSLLFVSFCYHITRFIYSYCNRQVHFGSSSLVNKFLGFSLEYDCRLGTNGERQIMKFAAAVLCHDGERVKASCITISIGSCDELLVLQLWDFARESR